MEARRGLESMRRELDAAVICQEFELAAELRERERQLVHRIHELEQHWREEQGQEEPIVTEEDIAQVVSMWTGIPLTRLHTEESERLLHMEEALHERVIGQDEAISTLARAVRRARAGPSSSSDRREWGRRCWRVRSLSSCSVARMR
jgi:ATP-dependent Clp protease ATP-binding subunit ClpC